MSGGKEVWETVGEEGRFLILIDHMQIILYKEKWH